MPPVRSVVVACVSKASSALRVSTDNSCRFGSEFKLVWSTRGVAPVLCVNNLSRVMTFAFGGKCPLKGTQLFKPKIGSEVLACADKDTGVLRSPRTGKCWWQNTIVKWLATLASDETSSTTTSSTTSSSTTSSSTTTSSTTTTVVTPSVTTTTVAPSNDSGRSGTTTTTTTLPDPTAPVAPTGISITASSGSLSVAFTAGSDGGSAITSYQYSTDGGTTFSARASGTTASPLVISTLSTNGTTPLTDGTAYSIQIRAVNAIGNGTATASTSATPAAPRIYVLGEVGPGGGIVFYVNASGFLCGPTLALTCKYLEAAPTSGTNAWDDTAAVYGWSGNTNTLIGANAQGTAIGTGYKNTEAMVAQSNVANKAGTIARAYRGPNNLSDWYLPSFDELKELCKEKNRIGIGPIATSGEQNYWTSSETDFAAVKTQYFLNCGTNEGTTQVGESSSNYVKSFTRRVRPVRAFG